MTDARTIASRATRDVSRSLDDLAKKINGYHRQFERNGHQALEHFSSALQYARRAGEMLVEAKRQIPHGGWTPWLEANCNVGERQARKFMAIADADPQLFEEATKEHMTINRLVERIAERKNTGKVKALSLKSAPGADLTARKSAPVSVAPPEAMPEEITPPAVPVRPKPQTENAELSAAAPPAVPQCDADWERLANHDLIAYARSLGEWANDMESLSQPYLDAIGPDIDQQPKSVRDAIHKHKHWISESRWVQNEIRTQIRALIAWEKDLASHCRRNGKETMAEIQRIAGVMRDGVTDQNQQKSGQRPLIDQ